MILTKRKISKEEVVEKAVQYAESSLAMEGLKMTDRAREIGRRRLRGEISEEEMLRLLRES